MTDLGLDTETTVSDDPDIVCFSVADGSNVDLVHVTDPIAPRLLLEIYSDNRVVGHNAGFDVRAILKRWPGILDTIYSAIEQGRVVDTLVAEWLINNACGTRPAWASLAKLMKKYYGLDLDKGPDTWRMRYGELKSTPIADWPDEAKSYAEDDAEYHLLLWQAQMRQYGHCLDYAGRLTASFIALTTGAIRGMDVDADQCDVMQDTIAADTAKLLPDLMRAGIYYKDSKGRIARSDKTLRSLVLSKEGAGCVRTDNGAPSTTKENLLKSKSPLLRKAGQYKYGAWKSTLINSWKQLKVAHPRYILLTTGRISTSHPTLQNLPREPGYRECWIPPKGYWFSAGDFAGQEMATLAQTCLDLFGHSHMAELLQQKYDLHTYFASEISGIPYDDMLARVTQGDPEAESARQKAKVPNFGLPGGMGANTLWNFGITDYGLDWSLGEATEARQKWLSLYPEVGALFRYIGKLVDSNQPIKLPRSGRLRYTKSFCAACNYVFQGSAADVTYRAAWLFEYRAKGAGLDAWIAAPVHDELIVCVPIGRADEGGKLLEKGMLDAAKEFCPDVPLTTEAHLMKRWYKKAKPVRDGEGRLIPWEPS